MWSPQPRSEEADGFYRSAEADRAARPERYRLEPEAIIAEALGERPLPADDDGDWTEGLEIYLASARGEGRLNALGLRNVAGAAIGRLRARSAIAAAFAKDSTVRRRKIDRPIFIIGGWRTGTTLLQRLLAAVPALRAARPAQLSAPWRFNGLDRAAADAQLAAGEGAHQRLHTLNPAMGRIHPSGARLAEECVLAMGTDFRNWGFTSTLRSPTYAAWLLRQDLAPSYRRYADILRLMQDDSDRRWVMKAPAHTAELPALFAAFPDALVVHLHRDVVQTVTSGASLFAVFRSTYSDQVDAPDVGAYQLEMTATWFEGAMAARDAHPQATVLDITFEALTADPIAIARAICAAAEIEWAPASQSAAETRLAELSAQHAAHRYSPADFGLEPGAIRERLAVYRDHFGVT